MGAQPPALLTLVNNSIAGDVLLTWLTRGALPCTTGITCFSSFRGAGPHLCPNLSLPSLRHSLISPKHTPPANTRAKKGAPPGALLSGKQLTIVLAAFTAVLQMSCRHLFCCHIFCHFVFPFCCGVNPRFFASQNFCSDFYINGFL